MGEKRFKSASEDFEFFFSSKDADSILYLVKSGKL